MKREEADQMERELILNLKPSNEEFRLTSGRKVHLEIGILEDSQMTFAWIMRIRLLFRYEDQGQNINSRGKKRHFGNFTQFLGGRFLYVS